MSDSQSQGVMTGRLSAVFLFGVIAVAFVGYFVGISDGVPRDTDLTLNGGSDSGDDESVLEMVAAEASDHAHSDAVNSGDSIVAVTYGEMRRSATGPTSQWKPSLQQIPQVSYDLFEEFKPSEADKEASTLTRASRRAFNGAPPIIPHVIEKTDNSACYACHGKGMQIGDRVANRMSHGFLANCTQCHAPPAPKPFATVDSEVETTFVGLPAPRKGERAFPGAPPTIPHTTWIRETCLACHGREAGWAGLESTHPWRINCQQCHAPSASLNQGITASPIPFLPEIPISSP